MYNNGPVEFDEHLLDYYMRFYEITNINENLVKMLDRYDELYDEIVEIHKEEEKLSGIVCGYHPDLLTEAELDNLFKYYMTLAPKKKSTPKTYKHYDEQVDKIKSEELNYFDDYRRDYYKYSAQSNIDDMKNEIIEKLLNGTYSLDRFEVENKSLRNFEDIG